ncbi:hypothetical protein KIN20_008275 [Parelaphostrongylus tenuis]|uniref:Uncharacterized protein n=1 Tax=Parelaphostrongylus tenuis TaxID=148309 RepID=A0AAD5MQY1_PARTN|nr:hypothetical protein KIN20_008275 [Parelaphostrongylus tenuis]
MEGTSLSSTGIHQPIQSMITNWMLYQQLEEVMRNDKSFHKITFSEYGDYMFLGRSLNMGDTMEEELD